MDPVQEELERYLEIRNRLQLELQEREEQLHSFYGSIREFEHTLLHKINPYQQKL